MRAVGEFVLVDALPDAVVVLFAAVTHFADPWFLFGLLACCYWFGDERLASYPRHAGATAIALVTCGYAGVALGKALFAAPRPVSAAGPADVPAWLPDLLAVWFETQVVTDGFGFPSGHATGAVVTYLGLALVCDRLWRPRQRLLAAGGVAAAVGLSRVAIEVHYLVDVVAGAGLGGAVVIGGLWLAGDDRIGRRRPWVLSESAGPLDPSRVFLLAAGVSAVAGVVALAGGHADEVVEAGIGVGTGIGGAVGWLAVDGEEPAVSWRVAVPALAATGLLWVGAFSLAGGIAGATLATSVAVVVVIALPGLAARLDE